MTRVINKKSGGVLHYVVYAVDICFSPHLSHITTNPCESKARFSREAMSKLKGV